MNYGGCECDGISTLTYITDPEKARIKAEEGQPVWGMIQTDNLEELDKRAF